MGYKFSDKSIPHNELLQELLSSEYCHELNGLTYEEILKVFKFNSKPVNQNKIKSLLAVWKQRKKCEFTKKQGRLSYFLNSKIRKDNSIQTVYLEAGKPLTALKKTGDVLAKIKGEVLICDNYFGLKTMVNLYKLSDARKIKFICGNIKGDESEIMRLVNDYNKEGNILEVKKFDRAQLHDRYVITEDNLIILGHGFADIGNKESLIISIPNGLVKDISEDLRNRFGQKWKGSKNLV